jgi:hypothetical protein
MEKTIWNNCVKNEEVLHRYKEEMDILKEIT